MLKLSTKVVSYSVIVVTTLVTTWAQFMSVVQVERMVFRLMKTSMTQLMPRILLASGNREHHPLS
jgi:hypothetical protein